MPNEMPTAAKLVGAIAYGGIGGLSALRGVPTLPDEIVPGYLVPLSACVGVWLGWSMIGRAAQRGLATAFTQSVVTLGSMAVVILLAISCWEMVERSMRLRYDGPGEAVLDVANLFVKFGALMMVAPVWQVLGAGAVIGALVVRFAGGRWS